MACIHQIHMAGKEPSRSRKGGVVQVCGRRKEENREVGIEGKCRAMEKVGELQRETEGEKGSSRMLCYIQNRCDMNPCHTVAPSILSILCAQKEEDDDERHMWHAKQHISGGENAHVYHTEGEREGEVLEKGSYGGNRRRRAGDSRKPCRNPGMLTRGHGKSQKVVIHVCTVKINRS